MAKEQVRANNELDYIKNSYGYFNHNSINNIDIVYYYDKIIENSIDGLFITDGEGNVIRVNKAYELISGIKREEIIGMHMAEFEKLHFISKSATLMVIEKMKPITIEQLLFRTGKIALVSCNPLFDNEGKITMIVSNIRDITELTLLKEKTNKEHEITSKYKSEIEILREQLFRKQEIIAKDEKTLAILHDAKKIAAVNTTVLINGETGVGKEDYAKFIHENSLRHNKHFIKVNCSAISKSLLESELFGYEPGAFTGAKSNGKMGLFEVANKGTIFLDEIGDMPLDMQSKILRVLQNGEIIKVGSNKPISVDLRIISATNKNLEKMVTNNEFREDLYYRLNVIKISIPPLRDRKMDIKPIALFYINKFNKKYNFNKKISNRALDLLENYDWPGNVRELINVVERSVILNNSDLITESDLSIKNNINIPLNEFTLTNNKINLHKEIEKFEYKYIKTAYDKYGNVRKAALALGISKSAFASKLKLYSEKFTDL